jgi:hypothetical protein
MQLFLSGVGHPHVERESHGMDDVLAPFEKTVPDLRARPCAIRAGLGLTNAHGLSVGYLRSVLYTNPPCSRLPVLQRRRSHRWRTGRRAWAGEVRQGSEERETPTGKPRALENSTLTSRQRLCLQDNFSCATSTDGKAGARMRTGHPCPGVAIRAKQILEEPKHASSRGFQVASPTVIWVNASAAVGVHG